MVVTIGHTNRPDCDQAVTVGHSNAARNASATTSYFVEKACVPNAVNKTSSSDSSAIPKACVPKSASDKTFFVSVHDSAASKTSDSKTTARPERAALFKTDYHDTARNSSIQTRDLDFTTCFSNESFITDVSCYVDVALVSTFVSNETTCTTLVSTSISEAESETCADLVVTASLVAASAAVAVYVVATTGVSIFLRKIRI
jgi:hypothetical protein